MKYKSHSIKQPPKQMGFFVYMVTLIEGREDKN